MSSFLSLLLAITVTFQWEHPAPSNVKEFKLVKGASPTTMLPVATIPAVANQTTYSFDYNFTDTTTQYFGITSSNVFGEGAVQTKDSSGRDAILGKPSPATSFSWSAKP